MEASEKAADDDSSRKEESKEGSRAFSVDRLPVQKIASPSSDGSRRGLLTKSETSRKLSVKLEAGKTTLTTASSKDEESFEEGKGGGKRSSLPEDVLAPAAGVGAESKRSWNVEERIRPIKLTKCPSIGSIAISRLKKALDAAIPEKPDESLDKVAEKDIAKSESTYGKVEGGIEGDAKDRLEKSQSNIEVLQRNLNTKIDATTALEYQKKLLESRRSRASKSPVPVHSSSSEKFVGAVAFDQDFLRKHNLDGRLKIEENGPLRADPSDIGAADEEADEPASIERSAKPSYGKRVTEVEKRWSGEFLESRLKRQSSESSESSYVEEFGSGSSRESVGEHRDREARIYEREQRRTEQGNGRSSASESLRNRASEETLADSIVSTVDSDSCLEDRIKAVDEDIEEEEEEEDGRVAEDVGSGRFDVPEPEKVTEESANRWPDEFEDRARINATEFAFVVGASSSSIDGYANLIREFTMEAGSSRAKKEVKQKKKLGLRRLLPGFFSPKDSRKDYKGKKEAKERKRPDDKHFDRYQQNGNYTRSPDTMNLNEDIKRNVKLDNSLNGSMIEERLDEIKRELFSDQGPITSTPDHLARQEDRALLRDRTGAPRSYTTDSSLSSIAPDDRWAERNAGLGISPDIGKFEQRQKREELGQRYGQLERKHSLQESNQPSRGYFFQRNHGPSGRISAPPSERYLVRPRAIHPIDRPLPAIPHSRTELSTYVDYLEERDERRERIARYGKPGEYANEAGSYRNTDNDPPGLILKSVSAQVKITRQPIVNQNQRAPLVGRSPKYLSSGSSQKSGDCGDSSCTPNSSQKSEFSPSSSKSGEYYLPSSRNSGSPNEHDFDDDDDDDDDPRRGGIYENEKSPSRSSTGCADDRIYDEASASLRDERCIPVGRPPQLERSTEIRQERTNVPPRQSPLKGERPLSPRQAAEKPEHAEREICLPTSDRADSARGLSSPGGSRGKAVSPVGPRQSLPPSRRAQPNEQILIASPKREVAYETRIPRPSNESRRCAVESPVHMTNAPCKLLNVSGDNPRNQAVDASRNVEAAKGNLAEGSPTAFPVEMTRPEPIYGLRSPTQRILGPRPQISPERTGRRNDCGDRVAWVPARASSSPTSPRKIQKIDEPKRPADSTEAHRKGGQNQPTSVPVYAMENRHRFRNTLPEQRQQLLQQQQQQQQQDPKPLAPRALDEPIYVQRVCEPIYGQRVATTGGPLSPSKQVTRQHLEAFYWQQKAIEAHRKSLAPPTNVNLRQMGRKIDLPEVREAVYWQQLKKLDEEQQRRIYEQNVAEEPSYGKGGGTNARTSTPRQESVPSPAMTVAANLSGSVVYGDPAPWTVNANANVRCSKANPMGGKPPLMQNQKGQNQPVLIVRPQQAIRERREIVPSKPLDPGRQETQRSKSASPHFHRGEAVPRKIDGSSSIYEVEINDADEKTGPPPPPIFKRGSLIGGESVEYGGTVGAKRVSFSNQSNAAGQDPASGSWPTKHGTAPEPPTRRHRSEDSVSDTDSVFSHQEVRRETPADYDADRPLPPLPKEFSPGQTAKPATGRGKTCGDARWNSRIDHRPPTGPRQVLEQKEEEWNSDGKGRQSNDTGGSGRGEGEVGSNEIPPGRRGGGIGSGGVGVGGGGSVLVVGGSVGGSAGRSGSGGGGGRSRDEPRRHTLGGDHQPSLHHQQFNAALQLHPLHPHHLPPHGQYGTPPTRHTTMDLEMGTNKSRQRKSPLPRGYPPPSSTMLFDDDPGIMSEVETSSTGFRRGGKQRSSLPVVRTPSKTLERPLGLVFLQYRNETKRALLPNEITSIDTVKALFVRSFPKQLTMEYLDSPHVKVYIHDSNKDMFYELEDDRSHLRDIRDRSVLRLFESSDGVTGMPGPLGIPGAGAGLPPHWEDQSYFSEPEFDSEYQHQHIHKSKTAKNSTSGSSGYYLGGSSTLPRGGSLMRAYSPAASSIVGGPNATPTQPKPLTTPGGGRVPPAKPLRSYQCGKSPLESLGGSARFSRDSSVSLYSIADRLHGESGYMSSPERGGGVGSGTGRYPPGPYSAGSSYEDPYYSQYSGTVTPVIDEEASDTELLEESYSLYGVKPPGRPPSGPPRSPFPPGAPPPLPPGGQSYDVTRIRVEHMERQLANLTGLVQKALTHAPPHTSPSPRDYLQVPAGRDPYARGPGAGDEFDKHSSSSSASLPDDSYLRTDVKPPKLGKDKSVSFEKSVSFSDEPPDMNSPKQHSPQHAADTKPTKPAIKSSTLPRMSSQERDRHKPTPPPKPAALVAGQYVYRDLALTPEMYNQLRGLQRKAKDLRLEVRNLRRMSQAQAHTIRETILDTFFTIRGMLLSCGDAAWDAEKIRLSREEDLYRQEMLRLKKDLTELENTVEELRGNVINKKTRVNMSDVENMALIMSKSSKTVADLKVRFPSLQEGMKGLLSSEMEMVVRAEKFLKEEPEQLELALKRCKKLTSTLVTLKRLASVQEQRLPNAAASIDAEETPPITPTSAQHSKAAAPVPAERTVVGSASVIGGGSHPHEPSAAHQQRPENALDALLDELQTFSRPSSQLGHAPPGSAMMLSEVGGRPGNRGEAAGAPGSATPARAPYISDIGRKGSVDSSSGVLAVIAGSDTVPLSGPPSTAGGTLRRLHSYPSSSDTDTSPPIARLQVSLQEQPSLPTLPQGLVPGQKPPVPERNAELLQLASARRVPPPPPPRTSSRSPLASPTSPQLPPRNHSCNIQTANTTLRRAAARGALPVKEGKPPMALPTETISAVVGPLVELGSSSALPSNNNNPNANNQNNNNNNNNTNNNSTSSQSSAVLSTSNSSSCESVNSQEGLQSKKGRQEQLEQRHQELLRKQKALQEQYARLQQLQRNTAGLTTVPPAPPDLLKKTGSESNLLAKMGLGLSAASSGSLTSLVSGKASISQEGSVEGSRTRQEESGEQQAPQPTIAPLDSNAAGAPTTPASVAMAPGSGSSTSTSTSTSTTATTTNKIYETDIL